MAQLNMQAPKSRSGNFILVFVVVNVFVWFALPRPGKSKRKAAEKAALHTK